MKTIQNWISMLMITMAMAGLLVTPMPTSAGEAATTQEPFIIGEADDINAFSKDATQFLAGNGLASPEMQLFMKPIHDEWHAILDRFTEQFGISPRILASLWSY